MKRLVAVVLLSAALPFNLWGCEERPTPTEPADPPSSEEVRQKVEETRATARDEIEKTEAEAERAAPDVGTEAQKSGKNE